MDQIIRRGIDVVSLANNHSANFGTVAFTDTLKLLEENGIAFVGGGRDSGEAYRPLSLEIKGTRVTFLTDNAISGIINAGPGKPGVAWIDMWPYAADDPEDLARMQEAVRQAKEGGGFVVVAFHWSEEYSAHGLRGNITPGTILNGILRGSPSSSGV